MNISDLISNINWLSVIVLTVVSFMIGFAWHQPFMFGKQWKQENNPNNIKIEINAPLIFGGTAVMHFIAITALSAVISGTGALNGAITGALIAFVWILPAMAGTYLFANRSVKLLLIDAGMYLVMFAFFGLILGVW